MGGNALKKYGISTSRKETDEFIRIGKDITSQLQRELGVETHIIKCFNTKESHGDLDVMIMQDENFLEKNINLPAFIKEQFAPQAIYNNGGVVSFDYDDFQIDIIPISEDNWEIAKTYMDFDPLGNISGKVYHKFGLSYGWNGLTYKFRSFSGSMSKSIVISKDARRIFEFAGYDYDRYLLGFETVEEIFDYLIGNKYFDPKMFEFENLKHIDRKRNLRRKSYHAFIEFLNENNIPKRYDFLADKDVYLPMIDQAFPEVKIIDQIKEFTVENERNRIISEKFNGNHIMAMYPELKGKSLGAVIRKYQESFIESKVGTYKEFILRMDFDKICNDFKSFYRTIENG